MDINEIHLKSKVKNIDFGDFQESKYSLNGH